MASAAESLEEIVALDDAGERADEQQSFHALTFPAKYGALAIKRLTAAFGSLADMGFAHLKRMKKSDAQRGQLVALVVPVAAAGEPSQLSEELAAELQSEFDGSLSVVDVLKRGPKTREAWEVHTKAWPLIFHASVAPEGLVEPITDQEAKGMGQMLRLAIASGERRATESEAFCCSRGCVIADPSGSADGSGYAVVADSQDRYQQSEYGFHTLFHPVMVAIDGVAARDRERGGDAGPSKKHRRTDPPQQAETRDEEEPAVESYLCTGYDVFVDIEPCVMCAMALVHSRARRVVFAKLNATDGALASVHRLHTIKSLNHRYRVFRLPVEKIENAV